MRTGGTNMVFTPCSLGRLGMILIAITTAIAALHLYRKLQLTGAVWLPQSRDIDRDAAPRFSQTPAGHSVVCADVACGGVEVVTVAVLATPARKHHLRHDLSVGTAEAGHRRILAALHRCLSIHGSAQARRPRERLQTV